MIRTEYLIAIGCAVFSVAIVIAVNRMERPSTDRPITRELQAAAADLNMVPVADEAVTLYRQAQIIRELAKREKARK